MARDQQRKKKKIGWNERARFENWSAQSDLQLVASTEASITFRLKRTINCIWVPWLTRQRGSHWPCVCGCWLAPSPRWVLFFSSSKPSLWADAIPSASSTCQMPSPALMADVLLDAVPATALAPARITVHFPASPPPPLCSAKPCRQRLAAKKRVLSLHEAAAPNVSRYSAKVWETFQSLGSFQNLADEFNVFVLMPWKP